VAFLLNWVPVPEPGQRISARFFGGRPSLLLTKLSGVVEAWEPMGMYCCLLPCISCWLFQRNYAGLLHRRTDDCSFFYELKGCSAR
jgi:hypothetical protein